MLLILVLYVPLVQFKGKDMKKANPLYIRS